MQVSTEVRALVEAEAKAVCIATKLRNDQFNQEMNAITAFRALKKIGGLKMELDKPTLDKVLQVLHKCSNASALRQAISTEAKKASSVANDIAAELLNPTK